MSCFPKNIANDTIEDLIRLLIETHSFTTATLEDGTVLLPSLTFTYDLDTGLYRISDNRIGITAGGEKMLDISNTAVSTYMKNNRIVSTHKEQQLFTDSNIRMHYTFKSDNTTDSSVNLYNLLDSNTTRTTSITDSNNITVDNVATFVSTSSAKLTRDTTSDTVLRSAFISGVGVSISLWFYKTESPDRKSTV